MAEWRKIRRDLAFSERFHSCSERARLAYVQSYPFTDREGRLPGSLRKLYATCFAMTGWTFEELESVIEDLIRVGLWFRYEDQPGRKVIQVERFLDAQGREHLGKEKPASKYAPPPEHGETREPESFRDDPGDAPEPNRESAGTEEKREEEKREEEGRIPRARVEASPKPDDHSIYEEKRHPLQKLSGTQSLESGLIAPRVKSIWTETHPHGVRYGFSDFDEKAIGQFSHAIPESDEELRAFFRKCVAAGCKTLEQALRKLNDAVFVAGTPAPNGRKKSAYEYFCEKEGVDAL